LLCCLLIPKNKLLTCLSLKIRFSNSTNFGGEFWRDFLVEIKKKFLYNETWKKKWEKNFLYLTCLTRDT
jgi:hypothetical protein